MHTLLTVIFLTLLQVVTNASPVPVVSFIDDAASQPVAQALANLENRIELISASDISQLPAESVVLLDGASDLKKLKLQASCLESFVNNGGSVLITDLADSLPHTGIIWQALGAAAPAEIPAAELFPSDAGNWMWTSAQEGEKPDHTRFIRKSFMVDKPVKRAFVRCTVDNLYTVYINGMEIGNHWSWFDHELWNISDRLQPGKNLLAYKARNVDGPGGMFAQIGIEYTDGTRELVVTDETWKFKNSEVTGWVEIDFDDASWGPAVEIMPMSQYMKIVDKSDVVEATVVFPSPHPIINAITDRFGTSHTVREVVPKPGATVLASAGDKPLIICGKYGQGRVVLLNTIQQTGGLVTSDLSDDLLANAILWLGHQEEGLAVIQANYPPAIFSRSRDVRMSFKLEGLTPAVDGTLAATITHDKQAEQVVKFDLHQGQIFDAVWESDKQLSASDDGIWKLDLIAHDTTGKVIFNRSLISQVVNPLFIPTNRHVVAQGMTVQFQAEMKEENLYAGEISAVVIDPWGQEIPTSYPEIDQDLYTWNFTVPDLAEGEYKFMVLVINKSVTLDSYSIPFTVVPRIDLTDFYPTTMRLSEFKTLNKPAIEREIEDIISHGFNTLTFSAHRLGAKPGELFDFAEDYAQQRGMAISYSFQGDFCLLNRDSVPPVSVFSPAYKDAIRPRIEAAVETCKQVPRLLNVQGYMDEPFQVSGLTFDDSPAAQIEFKRRYGIDLPTREQAMQNPALWLKYIDFWSDCFAAGWRQSYAMVKELYPDFWVELTHDSHSTFGAAGNNFKAPWAIDDVYHWGAPFDAVNYDVYPYLSIDFRTGKFAANPLPRIAGTHMAFSQMRNLAYSNQKKLGFWVESGWSDNLSPTSPVRDNIWSPRELTYTAIAAGCDYLNTFWGIPEDPRWWETYRSVMQEVKNIAPLLTRSKVPQAKAAYIFPRTQHVLLQEEYWNVMVALEAFRQAYGELDCVHEEQISAEKLNAYKVLVLFDVHLLKRNDAKVIKQWVEAGGRLIADEVPSLDENKQDLNVFESVFGITGSAEIQAGAVQMPESDAKLWGQRSYRTGDAESWIPVINKRLGEGEAVLLNFPLKDCYLDALVRKNESGVADAILNILRQAATAGDSAGNVTSSNPNIEAGIRQTPQGTTLLFLINHESKDEVTQISLPHLPAGGVIRDMISDEELNAGENYTMTLRCPWGETRVIGIFPSDPDGLEINSLQSVYTPNETVKFRINLGGEDIRGNYLLDVTVTGPDGRKYEAFSALTCTENGSCKREIKLPVNAQSGVWSVHAKSLWDGAEATWRFEIKVI